MMSLGAIEETIKWRRHGRDEPWLPDSFMAELSDDAIRQLERYGRVRKDIGAIASKGDDAGVIIVLNGAVKVFRLYWGGRQALVHIAGHGDVLNAEAPLTGRDLPHTMFAANHDSAVLVVPRQRFGLLVARDEDVHRALARSFARRLQEQEMWLGHIGRTTEARVWAFLVGLARRHGRRFSYGTRLDLGLTQSDIAAALGVSISSVENAMRNLRNAGQLSTGYAFVALQDVPSEETLDRDY
jgi:CRP-like cAMP-binding protein